MKKRIMKTISIIMTFVLLVTAFPVASYAYEYILSGDWNYYVLADGTAEITSVTSGCKYAYYGMKTEVVIPNEIDGYVVTRIGSSETPFSSVDLVRITIPDTVLAIEGYAFAYNKLLSQVNLSNNITEIEGNTFSNCTSLSTITIPKKVVSIEAYAFYGCSSLSNVYLSENLTTIGNYAFSACTALKNIIVPESVTSIGVNAFPITTTIYGYLDSYAETYAEQYGFKFIPISKYSNDTIYTPITKNKIELTKYIGDVESFEIPTTIDDYSVVAIADEAFKDNKYITEVSAEDELLRVGVSAFENCRNLTTVVLPDCVKTIGSYAFSDCRNLSKIVLPSGLTAIEEYTFKNCKSLKSIIIPESVTEIDLYAFYNCLNLDTIYGVIGSYAETFAEENGYSFIDVSNMIVNVSATDITIIENSEGYETSDDYSNEFFYYYTNFMYNDVKYEVEYGNGKTEKLDYWELEELTGGSFDFADNQYEKPFELGNNKVSFSCGDILGTVKVIIVENPVVSMSIQDVAVIEGTCGYFSTEYDEYYNEIGEYYKYSNYDKKITVTLKDGSTIESNDWGSVELYGMWYSLSISDYQDTNHWDVGAHMATGTLLGVSDEFTVEITESPIESVSFEDIEIVEHTSGYYTNAYNPETGEYDLEYYQYHVYCNGVITMKDGTVIKLKNDNSFEYNGGWYSLDLNDTQSETPWEIYNTYKVEAYVMGKTFDFDVSIIDTKIKSMTITPARSLVEGVDSFDGFYDVNGIDYMLCIEYKDGTTEIKNSSSLYYDELELVHTQDEERWYIGTHTITAKYQGYTTTFEIEVVENPYNGITISNENGLTIYFNKKDGTSDIARPYDLCDGWGEDGCIGGILYTDIGNYNADFHFKYDEYRDYKDQNVKIVIGDMESNTLEKNNWLKGLIASKGVLTVAACCPELNGFNGEINAKNIDGIVDLCFAYCDLEYEETETQEWCVAIKGDDVKQAICEIFGIENVDLSLSENYDEITDTIISDFGGYGNGDERYRFSYSDGIWTFIRTCEYDDIKDIAELQMNESLKVIAINWSDKVMDINDDDNIDLLDYDIVVDTSTTSTILTRSEELSADANEDGAVDAFDAIYIDLYLNGMI